MSAFLTSNVMLPLSGLFASLTVSVVIFNLVLLISRVVFPLPVLVVETLFGNCFVAALASAAAVPVTSFVVTFPLA